MTNLKLVHSEVQMKDYVDAQKLAVLKLITLEEEKIKRDDEKKTELARAISVSKFKIIEMKSRLFKLEKGIVHDDLTIFDGNYNDEDTQQ